MPMRHIFLLPTLLLMTVAAAAQQGDEASPAPPPVCSAEHDGALSCQAGKSCRCVMMPAVPARGLPARWAFDCGVNRPACDIAPAGIDAAPYVTPGTVILDRRDKDRKKRKGDGG